MRPLPVHSSHWHATTVALAPTPPPSRLVPRRSASPDWLDQVTALLPPSPLSISSAPSCLQNSICGVICWPVRPREVSRRASRAPTVVARRERSRSTVTWHAITPFPSRLQAPLFSLMSPLPLPRLLKGARSTGDGFLQFVRIVAVGEGAHSPPSRHWLGGSGFRTPTSPGGAKESGETRSRAGSPVMYFLALRSSLTLIPSPRRLLLVSFSFLLPTTCPGQYRLSSVCLLYTSPSPRDHG